MKLTQKEWSALVRWFRAEEATLRYSYGEPGRKEETYRKNYAAVDPIASALYEGARQVIEGELVES
jgi:hypothetical protein